MLNIYGALYRDNILMQIRNNNNYAWFRFDLHDLQIIVNYNINLRVNVD